MPRVLFGVTVPITALAFLRDQLIELAAQGWDVHLATAPDAGFEKCAELPGVTVHGLKMVRDPAPAQDLLSLWQWRELIGDVRPDAVVASTPKAGLLGMLAARQQRVPVRLYHARGLRAEGLNGLKRRVSLTAERLAIRSATDVLCDSESLRTTMHKLGLLGPEGGVVLGSGSCCGVDTEHFRPPTAEQRLKAREVLGVEPDGLLVGFVGRLALDKGVLDLLTAVSDLHRDNPRVRLALVGSPEDPALDEAIATGVRQGWVLAPGPVADPRPSYWAFDVFCLPSYREGFPISPLEAQACGVAAVTTTATGCRDAVLDHQTGLLVPSADVPALRAALKTLLSNAELRAAMGSAGSKWARTSFERGSVRRRFIRYLTGLLHQGSPLPRNE